MVEGWLSHLTEKSIRRGSFRNVPELRNAINGYVKACNGTARPWIWTKDAKKILDKIAQIKKLVEPVT
ncbi:MAG: hypothetical protein M1476_05315 [Candidatus Thermoplasmatota archaeon]|nr:hypothetical protein [Candidatus Thermoplasmatota archaeon]